MIIENLTNNMDDSLIFQIRVPRHEIARIDKVDFDWTKHFELMGSSVSDRIHALALLAEACESLEEG